MSKTRSFAISPLPSTSVASLAALGKRIATNRKAQGMSQRDMACKIGISPQTMLFIEQGRPNVQIGHYARALSALAAEDLSADALTETRAPDSVRFAKAENDHAAANRADALRQHVARQSSRAPQSSGLEFDYQWSNSGMVEETLIRKVADKGRFHDLALICKRFGLDRVRQVAVSQIDASPSLRRALANIEQGFARA